MDRPTAGPEHLRLERRRRRPTWLRLGRRWGGDCAAEWRLLDPSGRQQSQLLADEARYASIITTGWDPELERQYNTYSFAGGCSGALQCQTQLAAIQFEQSACAGQAPSVVASCIEQAYNTITVAVDADGNPVIVGGNYKTTLVLPNFRRHTLFWRNDVFA